MKVLFINIIIIYYLIMGCLPIAVRVIQERSLANLLRPGGKVIPLMNSMGIKGGQATLVVGTSPIIVFHYTNVRYFRQQVCSIEKNYFPITELKYALTDQTWSEGWNEPDLWVQDGPMNRLFSHYLPKREKKCCGSLIPRVSVEAVGLIMCGGK